MNEPEASDRATYMDAGEGFRARMLRAAVGAVLVASSTAGR